MRVHQDRAERRLDAGIKVATRPETA
jgi:hypothetical protein